MLVEIKGVQFVNKGAALMLQAIRDRLQRDRPGLEFALTPGANASFRQVARFGAWQRLRAPGAPLDVDAWSYRLPRRLHDLARRYGIVTESDVDAVLDASGFLYGAAWGDAELSRTAREVERLAAHGKPYIFLPQAFGPFEASRGARAFGRALGSASLVCARDPESLSHLRRLAGDVGERLQVFPDFTVGLPGLPEAAVRWGVDRRTALLVPNANMLSVRGADPGWRDGYVPLLAALAARLAELGMQPRVMNHEGAADAVVCEALRSAIGAGEVIVEDDPRQLKGVIGAAGVVVCSRYHGCVSALAQGVPCLGTSWSHKYGALFDDFGVREFLLGACDERAALAAIALLLADRDAVSARLHARRPALDARVDAMWSRVSAILDAARR